MIEWRIIEQCPGYEVSERGCVRGIPAKGSRRTGVILKPQVNRNGYLSVLLRIGNRKLRVRANRLVCEAWHGPPPTSKHHAAHKDGNQQNNHYSNLRWATAQENIDDRTKHGTTARGRRHGSHTSPARRPRGDQHGMAKLTWEDVRRIRAEYTGKRGQMVELARRYGLTLSPIFSIIRGKTWVEPHGVAI